jgi:hypothetical protein
MNYDEYVRECGGTRLCLVHRSKACHAGIKFFATEEKSLRAALLYAGVNARGATAGFESFICLRVRSGLTLLTSNYLYTSPR